MIEQNQFVFNIIAFLDKTDFFIRDKILMSVLIDYLNYILRWLEQNKPSFAESLQPGLSQLQIRERLENEFPLFLPTEFYELYQWRNGVSYGDEDFARFFPGYTFYSLEYAIDQYQELVEDAEEFAEISDLDSSDTWRHNLLPIFSFNMEDYICILGSDTPQKTYPMLEFFGETRESIIRYDSLTSMMKTIVECYITEVYYLNVDGYIEVDYSREESIRRQYNNIQG